MVVSRERILGLFAGGKVLNTQQVAKRAGLSQQQAATVLTDLNRAGLLELPTNRDGSARTVGGKLAYRQAIASASKSG